MSKYTPCPSLDVSWALATSPVGWILLVLWSASWTSWCHRVASPWRYQLHHCWPGHTQSIAWIEGRQLITLNTIDSNSQSQIFSLYCIKTVFVACSGQRLEKTRDATGLSEARNPTMPTDWLFSFLLSQNLILLTDRLQNWGSETMPSLPYSLQTTWIRCVQTIRSWKILC